jgi:hypothetical protein
MKTLQVSVKGNEGLFDALFDASSAFDDRPSDFFVDPAMAESFLDLECSATDVPMQPLDFEQPR